METYRILFNSQKRSLLDQIEVKTENLVSVSKNSHSHLNPADSYEFIFISKFETIGNYAAANRISLQNVFMSGNLNERKNMIYWININEDNNKKNNRIIIIIIYWIMFNSYITSLFPKSVLFLCLFKNTSFFVLQLTAVCGMTLPLMCAPEPVLRGVKYFAREFLSCIFNVCCLLLWHNPYELSIFSRFSERKILHFFFGENKDQKHD